MTLSCRPLIVTFLLGLSLAAMVEAQAHPQLVANIRAADSEDSFPGSFATLNENLAVFVSRAAQSNLQAELWRTDGTTAGTQRLATLPASSRSYSVFIVGDRAVLYSPNRSGLWSTDGTVEGTFELITADIDFVHHDTYRDQIYAIGEAVSGETQRLYASDGSPEGTTTVEGPFTEVAHAYRIHSTQTMTWLTVGGSGNPLWRTDGTTEGTSIVVSNVRIWPIFGAGEHLIFTRTGTNSERTFWRTNGTEAGTELIPHPYPDRAFDFYGINFIGPETIFFVAGDLRSFQDKAAVLYHLDPRSGPMIELASFDAPVSLSDYISFNDAFRSWTQAAVVDDVLYFTPRTQALGTELWRSDGTVDGTHLVADLCPGPCDSLADLRFAAPLGDEFFLPLDDGSGLGTQAWRTAGTAATTRIDSSFGTPTCTNDLTQFVPFEERLLVARPEGLWLTNGTDNGTKQLSDGTLLSSSRALLANGLVFSGTDGFHGAEPWITDGTPSGTGMIKDLAFVEGGSKPRRFTPATTGDRVFFVAEADRIVGEEVWTASANGGIARVAPVPDCNTFASVKWITTTDSHVFFGQAYDTSDSDRQNILWSADADGANPRQLAHFGINGLAYEDPPQPMGDSVAFRAEDRLWISDGTPDGTTPITPEDVHLQAGWLSSNGTLYARESGTDRLWISDGTVAGTHALDNALGEPVFARGDLVPFNGRVYFDRSRTDGTPAGTIEISAFADLFNDPVPEVATKDHLYYTTFDAAPLYSLSRNETVLAIESIGQAIDLVATDSSLYFRYGDTVWVTRGTEGTTLPLLPAPFLFLEDRTAATGDHLFFVDSNAPGLWTSDGTVAGTRRVATNIQPSLFDSAATDNGLLFFPASNEESGSELWRTDGTTAGTLRVADVEPGPIGSEPGALAVAEDHLYFAATTTAYGREPWQLELAEPGLLPLYLGDDDRFELTVRWTKPNGESGMGQPVRLTDDTGNFWFFNETNVELVVKVLDARPSNGHFWVFYGSLSNVAYTLEVRDTVTGASRTYENPPGNFGSVGDTQAFPADPEPFAASTTSIPARKLSTADQPIAKGTTICVNTTDALCLQQQRFRVEVTWQGNDGVARAGTALSLSPDTGYFWFGNSTNVELIVKVLDGRNNNGNFWVFYGALSNLAYTLTVTDTETGAVRVYDNPRGSFASRGDTEAFPE